MFCLSNHWCYELGAFVLNVNCTLCQGWLLEHRVLRVIFLSKSVLQHPSIEFKHQISIQKSFVQPCLSNIMFLKFLTMSLLHFVRQTNCFVFNLCQRMTSKAFFRWISCLLLFFFFSITTNNYCMRVLAVDGFYIWSCYWKQELISQHLTWPKNLKKFDRYFLFWCEMQFHNDSEVSILL